MENAGGKGNDNYVMQGEIKLEQKPLKTTRSFLADRGRGPVVIHIDSFLFDSMMYRNIFFVCGYRVL